MKIIILNIGSFFYLPLKHKPACPAYWQAGGQAGLCFSALVARSELEFCRTVVIIYLIIYLFLFHALSICFFPGGPCKRSMSKPTSLNVFLTIPLTQ